MPVVPITEQIKADWSHPERGYTALNGKEPKHSCRWGTINGRIGVVQATRNGNISYFAVNAKPNDSGKEHQDWYPRWEPFYREIHHFVEGEQPRGFPVMDDDGFSLEELAEGEEIILGLQRD